jgi:ubiquitin thioesterase protein OTUB1
LLTELFSTAIGFSYFEKLIDTGDRSKVENEATRLLDMNPMLGEVGGYDYYEDWAEDFVELLHEVANNIDNPAVAHDMLVQKWNDITVTSGMIYYMRLLAATYLKSNAETYDPFIADSGGVVGYCSQSIEIINREIEHLGIVALVNVLLKPVNFVLEIAYLDRSPGSQVNTYRFPEEANNQDTAALGPIIYLLYRPDHYDILYRPPPNPPSQPLSIQVHRVSSLTDNATISSTQNDLGAFSTVDFGTLAMIPGFGGTNMHIPPPSCGPQVSEAFQPSQEPQSPWASSFGLTPTSQPTPPQGPVVTPGPSPNPPLSPHANLGPSQPPRGMSAQPGMTAGSSSLTPSPECSIRFSPMQLEYDGSQGGYPEPTFQVKTNTFKNSVWNRAHFGNPDFHPEEWSPDGENIDTRLGSKRRGSRKEL